jgi:hypothetical protein
VRLEGHRASVAVLLRAGDEPGPVDGAGAYREAHDVAAGPVENAAVVAVDRRDVSPGILHVHLEDVLAQELVGVRERLGAGVVEVVRVEVDAEPRVVETIRGAPTARGTANASVSSETIAPMWMPRRRRRVSFSTACGPPPITRRTDSSTNSAPSLTARSQIFATDQCGYSPPLTPRGQRAVRRPIFLAT